MPSPLRPILSRWEIDPPAVYAREVYGPLRDVFETLRDRALVRPLTPAGAADCSECSRRCRVEFIADQSGVTRGFIHCGDCGLMEIPAHLLVRWELDTHAMLTAVFSDAVLAIQQRVPDRLWQVGKATWAGRSRDVWFVRAFRRGHSSEVTDVLRTRPKAIVFAPTEAGAERWAEAAGNLVIPLEAVISQEAGVIRLDTECVEGRILDAGWGTEATPQRRTRKRADRAANIESLKKGLIEHLRAARDYAFATKEQSGEPQLLPRPTQKALGREAGLTESDVSRCLNDPEARELRLYWDAAVDLDRIMTWKGPLSTGRKT